MILCPPSHIALAHGTNFYMSNATIIRGMFVESNKDKLKDEFVPNVTEIYGLLMQDALGIAQTLAESVNHFLYFCLSLIVFCIVFASIGFYFLSSLKIFKLRHHSGLWHQLWRFTRSSFGKITQKCIKGSHSFSPRKRGSKRS